MILIWFFVWLANDLIGAPAPLHFDPVNIWTATLILSLAVDIQIQGGSR